MKSIGFFLVGVALLATLVACGGGEKPATDGGAVSGPGGGMVAPNQFLTYDGQRYELVNLIFEDMVPSNEFEVAGLASESDVDLKGDMRVYTRTGDTTAVYTYSAPTPNDNAYWLAWRLAS